MADKKITDVSVVDKINEEDCFFIKKNGTLVQIPKSNITLQDFGVMKTLWQGECEPGGIIEVPDTDKYNYFEISMKGMATRILVSKMSPYLRGMNGYPLSIDGSTSTYQFYATHEDNAWTIVGCYSMNHEPSGSHSGKTNRTVSQVRGVI